MSDLNYARIEAACKGLQNSEDMRRLLRAIYAQFELHNAATGTNFVEPTNSPQNAFRQPPPVAKASVTGANGLFNVFIDNPTQSVHAPIYHELSYSEDKTFATGVTTLPPSTQTAVPYAAPGMAVYWRIRSSFDLANWNTYQVIGSAVVNSGLQSSQATNPNLLLNQTNYANITSRDPGTGVVQIQVGAATGPYSNFNSVRGGTQSARPSATIVNVDPGVDKFVAWDGEQYRIEPQLPNVLDDGLEPIGAVSVVGAGAFSYPAAVSVIQGGQVIAYNILAASQGNGLTGPLDVTVSGDGHDAAAGQQFIQNGKLIYLAPGNPGGSYSFANIAFSGATYTSPGGGGGGITGGNGGRLFQTRLSNFTS